MNYNIKYCEACKCNLQECLHLHHTSSSRNRKIGKAGEEVMLCANCHEIIHKYLGGKSALRTNVLTKRGTLIIILGILKKYCADKLPYWFYTVKDIQRDIEQDSTLRVVDNMV